jgi:hypothetical protein
MAYGDPVRLEGSGIERRMKTLRGLVVLVCAACGGSDGPTAAIDAAVQPDAVAVVDAASTPDAPVVDAAVSDAATASDAGDVHVIPNPGTGKMAFIWPDTEPNDTPEQAVPLGIGSGQIGPYIGLPAGAGSHLGGDDVADYFVFRTSPDTGSTFIARACWDPSLNVNLLDIALYKVVAGQPLIPVASSNSTDKTCDGLEPFNIPLEPDTTFLFALINVEGEGEYNA